MICEFARIRGRVASTAGLLVLLLAWSVCAVAQETPPAEGAPPATPPAEGAPAEEGSSDLGAIRLPKLEEMQAPSLEELMNGPSRDWVVLTTDEVVVSEPIVPRPNTLETLEFAFREKEKERRGKVGQDFERWKRELEDLRFVNVSLPGPPAQEARIARAKIARIIYNEDHKLAKIDELLSQNNIETANELLTRFERQWPDWPGLADRRYQLILTDANAHLAAGETEAALVLAEELIGQKADFPGASELAGQAVDRLVTEAQQANDPIRARHYLLRLNKMVPDHSVFQRLSATYGAEATAVMNQAVQAGREGKFAEAATLADRAVSMWPPLATLKSPQKIAFERYQRLRVGVVRLPGTLKATPFDGEAEVRARRLSENRLFEIDDFRGGVPHYRTSYLDEWEPFDLGRRMRFTLTQTRQPWEAQPRINADLIASALEAQLDPQSEVFDERLASYIRNVSVESPFEFSLTFDRVPTRIEPVLRSARSVQFQPPAAAAQAEKPATGGLSPVAVAASGTDVEALTGGFPIVASDERQTVYRRFRPEPDGLPAYHVTEIIEVLFPHAEKAYQALLEGNIWMLPDMPDWIVRRAQADRKLEKEIFIQKYALPTTHVLQFNPRSRALGFRELRRALLQSIDRDHLLFDVVLREKQIVADEAALKKLVAESSPTDERVVALTKSLRDRRAVAHGRVVNTPFPTFSYANSPQLVSQGFDLSSAVAMTLAVKGQMNGEIPPLRLAVPPEPIPQAIATQLIRAWKRVGINVVQVEAGTADAAGWDVAYRTLQIEEPVTELWQFLTVQDRARIDDLSPFPDWMKQELIALDRTADWNRAVELVQTLHRHLWADVRFIPLWEVDGYMMYRRQVRGVPQEPLHCYEQIDRWNLEAWYATETP